MFYEVSKYSNLNVKTKYSPEQVNELVKKYVEELNARNEKRITARLDVDTLEYCKELIYLDGPVWFADLIEKTGNKTYCFFKKILVSDKNGEITDAVIKPDKITDKTFLSVEDAYGIADDLLAKAVQKLNGEYTICKDDVVFDISYRDSSDRYLSVWVIPAECKNEKNFSDPNIYIHISDYSGEIVSVMNCHGRDIKAIFI